MHYKDGTRINFKKQARRRTLITELQLIALALATGAMCGLAL